MVPDINQISFLRENECLQTFIFLKKGVQETEIALKIDDQEILRQKINVADKDNIISTLSQKKDNNISLLHKLGNFKFVKKLIYNYMQEGNALDDVYYAKQ